MVQVKERGGVEKKGRKPSPPSPPSFIFWLSFHFSRGQNLSFFAPKPNGNACHAGHDEIRFCWSKWKKRKTIYSLIFISKENQMGHFRVASSLSFNARLSAKPLMWKYFFTLIQIKLICTRKVLHLASFWKWEFLELGNGLVQSIWHIFDNTI